MLEGGRRDIRRCFAPEDGKVIFGTKEKGIAFLDRVGTKLPSRTPALEVWERLSLTWNYCEALPIVREMFRTTEKYLNGTRSEALLPILVEEWQERGFGEIGWPISQSRFDTLAQRTNSLREPRHVKDERISEAAVRFRRMKELVTARNDFVEKLLFDANEEIIPTLAHTRAADFFIRGERFDQKVSKSVGEAFKVAHGASWRDQAVRRPELVAKSLYENQDEDRFSAGPKLYVVDVDGSAFDPNQIRSAVRGAVLAEPTEVTFTYRHTGGVENVYNARCIVVLLLDPAG